MEQVRVSRRPVNKVVLAGDAMMAEETEVRTEYQFSYKARSKMGFIPLLKKGV